MSVHVSSAVWKLDLPAVQKIVLLKLADCANDDGRNAWPSVETIATECGLGERTVQRTLRQLVSLGAIAIDRPANRHLPTMYRVSVRGAKLTPLQGGSGVPLATSQGCQQRRPGVPLWHPIRQ